MTITETNAGLAALIAFADRDEAGAWLSGRWKALEPQFQEWCKNPAVNDFVSDYAASIAADLQHVSSLCSDEDMAMAMMEGVEDLARQTAACAAFKAAPARTA